jgi:phosphatidylserine decarboxylase
MELLRILPKNLISRLTGDIVSLENPKWLVTAARNWFAKRYKINLAEAEFPIEHYSSIQKLFTRKLKPGIRPIGEGLVHPCDARLTLAEIIEQNTLIQAKGKTYDLNELLASSSAAEEFQNGAALVYYLCPTDYHRVHSPVDGEVVEVIHVPGELWPVNEWSVQNIQNLFSVNERVIYKIKTPLGLVALVMVGATNVGQISVSFDSSIVTNSVKNNKSVISWAGTTPFYKKYNPPHQIKKGEELGVFNMGSTVVMIYAKNMLNVVPRLGAVKLGASL